ncbi:MAG: histidine kinase [Gaiellales bacterium]
MPSPSRFASRSSIRAALVAATVAAALVGAIGLALGQAAVSVAGLIAATLFAGAFAVYLIVSERRRHETAEDELQGQTSVLESLVEAVAAVSMPLDPDEIVARIAEQAKDLFGASEAVIQPPSGRDTRKGRVEGGRMTVPLVARDESLGTLELTRADPFGRGDLAHARVLVEFAARAVENARLLGEARDREAERARLAEQLITAEQDERRRLSLFLHDGPLQTMSGIALMHDAAIAAIRDGRLEDAAKVMEGSLQRERETIQELRDLSFAIEPLVLRDQGFGAAVRALGDQVEGSQRIAVTTDVEVGERLTEKAQVALYQIIREAMSQAVRRGPKRIAVLIQEEDGGEFAAEIVDDGLGERRRASVEAMEERTQILNGHLAVEHRDGGGTLVRVVLPRYLAAAQE